MAVYQKIVGLAAEILNMYEDDISPDMELTPEAGVEKLNLVKLVMECEKLCKVTIHDEDVGGFRTVRDVARYIEKSLAFNAGNLAESSEEERLWWYYE